MSIPGDAACRIIGVAAGTVVDGGVGIMAIRPGVEADMGLAGAEIGMSTAGGAVGMNIMIGTIDVRWPGD